MTYYHSSTSNKVFKCAECKEEFPEQKLTWAKKKNSTVYNPYCAKCNKELTAEEKIKPIEKT